MSRMTYGICSECGAEDNILDGECEICNPNTHAAFYHTIGIEDEREFDFKPDDMICEDWEE